MVRTEQENTSPEQLALKLRLAKLEYALVPIAAVERLLSTPELSPTPEVISYQNPEVATSTNNMQAIMDAIEQAYNIPNEG